MEARVSDLTKKPFKGWKNLFQIFLNEDIFEKAQKNDDGLSCFLMGLYYELDCMVEQNYDLALKYFHLGANKRDPLCLYKLYEIHSGMNFYSVEPDNEIALLYLVWAVVYAFPVYGSYMCLDFDLELQSYYKFTLKQDKQYVFDLIDNYDDDIFAHDKELIKCVFDFLIEFVSPSLEFAVQKGYQKMIDRLIKLAEINDPRFVALFLFKCVLWDFKGVTDRNHSRISDIIRRKKCISFIFEQLRGVFDYVTLVNKRHTIFLRLLHFHSIEIFLQVKYNSDPDDIVHKEDVCFYLINFLQKNMSLMDNNFTKSMAVYFVAKSHLNGKLSPKNLSQAISIIESSRSLPGFAEQDFPFVLGGRLYSEIGNNAASEKCFEKYLTLSDFTTNLPSKLYEQGKYFEYCKKDNEKALEAYIKGLQSKSDTNTFVQECYAKKCRAKILKLVRSKEEFQSKVGSMNEKTKFLQDFEYGDVTCV